MSLSNPCQTELGTRIVIPAGSLCSDISPEWVEVQGSTDIDSTKICERQLFSGSPIQCCANDFAQTGVDADCFSDSEQKSTCPSNFRSILGTGCENLFLPNCVNNLTTDSEFRSAWSANDNYCPKIIRAHVESQNGVLPSQQDIQWAQQSMEAVFTQYYGSTNDGRINPSPGVGTFQETLYDLCFNNPSACNTALNSTCSLETSNTVTDNVTIGDFCGCHLPQDQYAQFSNFGISQDCNPLCARAGVIPMTDSAGQTQNCTANICVIDDVTFNFVDSQAGNVTFNQICGGCSGAASCQCFISGTSISTVDSQIGNVDISQNCSGPVTCFQPSTDPNGSAMQVPCSDSPTPSGGGTSQTTIILIVVIAIAAILIFAFIIYLIQQRRTPITRYQIVRS